MMLKVLIILAQTFSCCMIGAYRWTKWTTAPSVSRRFPDISYMHTALSSLATSGDLIPPPDQQIVSVELNEELRTSFMAYAMSTILGRALPDARDGMKPVHRRVLYAMHELNLYPDSGYRKCARVVGEVLGKYHPHGDQSVYDALVRMAQNFVMQHPLVAGHGNYGSVDGDPPAAMRYTEARLSSLAFEALLADIKDDTVDFNPNFDGNEVEPLVLPARLPMLLVNGASGIAVGMATNIPPHNLAELADAIVALIKQPQLSDEDLFNIVPAPDFPTGGILIGKDGARQMFQTGRGSITIRAKTNIEVVSARSKSGAARTRNAIIVTELPYMTNKAALLAKIADLVNDKKLDGIADLRDETDREGMRIVIELKRDAIPQVVQNNLFKKTALQGSFSGNMLALVDKGTQPRRLSLREALNVFINFRFDTIRRRSAFQLARLQARDHVVEGMLRALGRIDEIITLMKKSQDTAAARKTLTSETYGFSSEQAEAILGLTLRRLTAMEESKLQSEHEDLVAQISKLTTLMEDDSEVNKIIINETKQLKKKHGVPRRSEISDQAAELSDEDLLANDRSVIVVTDSGYVKRVPILEFEAQSRGGRGKAGAKMNTAQDSVAHFIACNDHDSLLFSTNRGIAYSVKAYQVPLGARTAKGVPLPQVLPITMEEEVTSVIPIDSFTVTTDSSSSSSSTDRSDTTVAEGDSDDGSKGAQQQQSGEYLMLLTTQGYVKKTPLKAFESITARGLTIISLGEGDSLRWTRRCSPNQQVFIATKAGFACRFTESDVTPTGRKSRGVRAIKLRDGDTTVDMDIASPTAAGADVGSEDSRGEESFALALTDQGYGKRISIDEFRTTRRGGKGVIITKFKSINKPQKKTKSKPVALAATTTGSGADRLSCMRICRPGDEIVLSTNKGTIIRQRVDDISIQSRTATGVRIQKLSEDERITKVDVVPPFTALDTVVLTA